MENMLREERKSEEKKIWAQLGIEPRTFWLLDAIPYWATKQRSSIGKLYIATEPTSSTWQ